MVPEIMTGTPCRAPRTLGDREQRRLGIERVENGFDQQQVGAAVEQAAHLLAVGGAQLVEVMVRKPGLLTSGEIEAVGWSGPCAPATKRGAAVLACAAAAASRASRAPSTLSSYDDLLHPVVGLGDPGRGEGVGGDDVGARTEIGDVDRADDPGWVR